MADNGNMEDDALPPLPRGTYNFNFDDLDENTNPFQTSSKVAMSPMPQRKNQPEENPFHSKSKLAHSPPTSPTPNLKTAAPPVELAGGDQTFDDTIDPFATRKALQNSPPLPRKTAYEVVENTVETDSPPRPEANVAAAPEQPKLRKTPIGQKTKTKKKAKRLSKEIKSDVVPPADNTICQAVSDTPNNSTASLPDDDIRVPNSPNLAADSADPVPISPNLVADSTDPVPNSPNLVADSADPVPKSPNLVADSADPVPNSPNLVADSAGPVLSSPNLVADSADPVPNSPNLVADSAGPVLSSLNPISSPSNSTEHTSSKNNKKGAGNKDGSNPLPASNPEPERKPTVEPAKKKQARIKKPVKPLKINKSAEEEVQILTPPSKPRESQDLSGKPADTPKPTSVTGEPDNQGTQSELLEQEGPSQDWSQTDDGMGESVQDDFPGDFPAEEHSGGSPEGEFVDCRDTSVHEFGTGDDQGLGDMGDEPNEEFVPASDVFTDPDAWEMLEKLGGEGNFKDTDLARQSLYVKFDPLNQVEDQMKGKSKEKVIDQPSPTVKGDDLMQMSTPPVKKGTPKQGKHPAVKRLEQQVTGTEDVGGARQVDQIYSMSPSAGEKDVDETELRRQFSIPEVPPVMGDSWFDQVNTFKEMEDSTMSQDSVDVFTGWSAAQDYPEGDPLGYEDREEREARSSSQELDQDADSGHAGSACTASPPKTGPGGEDDLVEMLKYSQHDMNKLRRDLEMDFQGRLLLKEREWGKKLADKDKDASNLRDQVEKIKAAHEDMKSIVCDYEKTISQLVADKEKSSSESKDSIGEIIKDRDQAVEDLRAVESAFSDLHRRYEKIKTVVDGFKKNEEILKKSIQDYQGKLKAAEQRFQSLKQQAEEKLDLANMEIEKVRKTTSSEAARLEAAVRKKDLQVKSLEKTLDTKIKENEELTSICDELIAKVGTGQ